MDDAVFGDVPISLDNMTRIETPRPVVVRHYHPRLKQMFREAISYCREMFKTTPPIKAGKDAYTLQYAITNFPNPFYESIAISINIVIS